MCQEKKRNERKRRNTFVVVQNQYMKEVKDIMATHKTGFMSSIYPIFVQLPVFTGYYFALTMMCSHHLPSMVVDSAPYGFDLTTSDPFHLAPLACSGTIMLAVRSRSSFPGTHVIHKKSLRGGVP
jgi:membrane protein insertase Oxa1/YidC/SpoIIIJ